MNAPKEIRFTLSQQQFDYILNVLAQRPYAEVAPVIAELGRQASAPPGEVVPLKDVSNPISS